MQELKHILIDKSKARQRSKKCSVCDYELYRDGFLIKIPSFDLQSWLCPCCKSVFDLESNTPIIILPELEEGIA